MMNIVIRFILSAIEIRIRLLCLSVNSMQEKMHRQNLCYKPYKITVSQYRKKFTIWELGKNKFT
jgi:hypothetical protein